MFFKNHPTEDQQVIYKNYWSTSRFYKYKYFFNVPNTIYIFLTGIPKLVIFQSSILNFGPTLLI